MVGPDKNFPKKTVADIELKNKRVLLRADYNVPIVDGRAGDDYRLRASLPTIEYILKHGAERLVIIAHLGRPSGPADKDCSLAPVAKRLSQLLDRRVYFVSDCVGDEVAAAINHAPHGSVILLENLRFHAGEEANDPSFAEAIVDTVKAQVFVQDGFGVVHRQHASTAAITKFLPAVAGILLEHEFDTIRGAMAAPERPLTAVVGGAKIADKIDVLKKFIEIADCVIVGGALANDFLVAEGHKVGASLVDKDQLELARDILALAQKAEKKRAFNFLIPSDSVVSQTADGRSPLRIVDLSADNLAYIQAYPKAPPERSGRVLVSERILDIGPISAAEFAGALKLSRTVIWSGTMGMAEVGGVANAAPFGHGTRVVAQAMLGASNAHAHKPFSIVGGGDTVAWVEANELMADFDHVSTGGSASLELMAGHKLPGVEALLDK